MKHLIPELIRLRIADLRDRGVYSGYPNEHKCIFVHIPKTAGKSIARSLFGSDSGHVRYTLFEKANPKKFASYFKFSFVRNPWDRLYSAYTFLKAGGVDEKDRSWAEENLSIFSDFNSFVTGWLNSENVMSWVHFYPQYYFICDDQLNLKMDFIGRFEELDADITLVQKRLGLPVKALDKVNASPTKTNFLEIYTEESRDIVARVYAKDIALFHYDFQKKL